MTEVRTFVQALERVQITNEEGKLEPAIIEIKPHGRSAQKRYPDQIETPLKVVKRSGGFFRLLFTECSSSQKVDIWTRDPLTILNLCNDYNK
jgi:hypothetical protein